MNGPRKCPGLEFLDPSPDIVASVPGRWEVTSVTERRVLLPKIADEDRCIELGMGKSQCPQENRKEFADKD